MYIYGTHGEVILNKYSARITNNKKALVNATNASQKMDDLVPDQRKSSKSFWPAAGTLADLPANMRCEHRLVHAWALVPGSCKNLQLHPTPIMEDLVHLNEGDGWTGGSVFALFLPHFDPAEQSAHCHAHGTMNIARDLFQCVCNAGREVFTAEMQELESERVGFDVKDADRDIFPWSVDEADVKSTEENMTKIMAGTKERECGAGQRSPFFAKGKKKPTPWQDRKMMFWTLPMKCPLAKLMLHVSLHAGAHERTITPLFELRAGPLHQSWTHFVERYVRFVRGRASAQNRTLTSMKNAIQAWLRATPLSGSNAPSRPAHGEPNDRVRVQEKRKWKTHVPTNEHAVAFLEAVELCGLDHQGGVFCRGSSCVVNGGPMFRTRGTESTTSSKNSWVICLFEEKGNPIQVLAGVEEVWKWHPRGEPSQSHCAFKVKCKTTTLLSVHRPSGFTLCSANTNSVRGSARGEFVTSADTSLANPMPAPHVNHAACGRSAQCFE
eukprot:jgi/Bigna1/77715/fgenesh1_pg.50_\